MGHKPNLLFAALRRDTADHYLAELHELFQDEVDLSTYVFEEEGGVLPDCSNITVILSAGPASHARCVGLFPADKLLLFERDISFPYYLDQVFLLLPGTKVLVVSELEVGALEVIDQLLSKGIDHVEYMPYWEGCGKNISGISVALSPGLFQFCPPGIPQHIDIRRRHLSVGTFISLLQRLGFGFSYLERLMEYHSSLLFQTYRRLSDQHSKSLRLQKSLETMFSNMADAILFSENGVITECNHVAEKLFRGNREYLVNKSLPAVLGTEFETHDGPGASYVLTIRKAQYLCTRTDIATHLDGVRDTRLYIIKSVSDLENMEAYARKLLQSKKGKTPKHQFSDIIAVSPSMRRVMDTAREMARSPLGASILLTGESGTGKELFAQAIHNASDRARYPFVAVNFGAIPENLVESELFGYESGAFTGASKTGKQGLFEVARYGTIFLDEIGDASPYIQARLLRVLEERELMRLGGTRTIPVDVRVIAATNKDLQDMCREGSFRTDLYHRLNTFPLKIPPLRERSECLQAMLVHFQSFYLRKREFSPEALRSIYQHSWPGNARELKNLIDFLTLKPGHDQIELEDLPHDLQSAYRSGQANDIVRGILPALREYAPLETVSAFLSLVRAHADRPLGRNRLIAMLAERNMRLSDAKCRSLIAFLAKHGLLEKGITKQGSRLTSKGAALLDGLRQNAAV
jgi:Transcriptional regulator containing PAS, AAA-type ATPase, and DNA-binding domains